MSNVFEKEAEFLDQLPPTLRLAACAGGARVSLPPKQAIILAGVIERGTAPPRIIVREVPADLWSDRITRLAMALAVAVQLHALLAYAARALLALIGGGHG